MTQQALPDGVYDAFVVDAVRDAEAARIEVTITAGAHKGEIVAVRTNDTARDPIELLGLPATLRVADGEPHLTIEQ